MSRLKGGGVVVVAATVVVAAATVVAVGHLARYRWNEDSSSVSEVRFVDGGFFRFDSFIW